MPSINLTFVGKSLDKEAFLKVIQDLPKPLWITGVSGSGKSFILHEILTSSSGTALDLDSIGHAAGGKWNVDVKAAVARLSLGSRIFVGTCSNSADLVRALKPRSIFILTLPGEEYWDRVAAKFHDGLEKRLPEEMLRNFGKLVALEPPKLDDYISSRAWRVLVEASAVNVDEIQIRAGAVKRSRTQQSTGSGLGVIKGWHTPSNKKGGSQ